MPRLLPVLFVVLLFGAFASAADPARVFTGKAVSVADKGVEFVADDGAKYALVEDDNSRMLLQDPQMQNRPVRLTARAGTSPRTLVVERVQTVKGGKVFDVDYWCAHCLLATTLPGPCQCCGGPTVLREFAVKAPEK